MKQLTHIFLLLGYFVLSYLYFVEMDLVLALYSWVGLTVLTFLVKSMRQHAPLVLLVGLCFSFLNILSKTFPSLIWPFDFYLAALFGFLLLKFVIRRPIEKLKWSFVFTKIELLSIVLINVPAIFILVWYYRSNPDVANMWPSLELPVWSIPFVVLLIAAVNGLREEIFYRGLLQTASNNGSPVWFVIGLQAVLFGFLHYMNAFPQGWLGVLLTAVWGAAIAIQYRIFKSISIAWVTHAMADAIMFGIIIYTRS